VHGLLQGASDRAQAILRENRDVLDRSAKALMERETLDEGELSALAGELRTPSATLQVVHRA
jgi:cell division protease FtsH